MGLVRSSVRSLGCICFFCGTTARRTTVSAAWNLYFHTVSQCLPRLLHHLAVSFFLSMLTTTSLHLLCACAGNPCIAAVCLCARGTPEEFSSFRLVDGCAPAGGVAPPPSELEQTLEAQRRPLWAVRNRYNGQHKPGGEAQRSRNSTIFKAKCGGMRIPITVNKVPDWYIQQPSVKRPIVIHTQRQ